MSPNPANIRVAAFDNNIATAGGGGAINFASAFPPPPPGIPAITATTFSNNSASADGGAIRVGGGANFVIEDSTLSSNSATNGGAITNGDFAGGAVGTVTCTRCFFTGNSATLGGAIFSRGALTLTDSRFSGNAATTAGGALNLTNINAGSPSATITGVTFDANSSGSDAGAAVLGQLTAGAIVNSTFSGNTAAGVGALNINNNTGTVTLNNVTIAGNTASGMAIGGLQIDSPDASVALANTIVAGNTAAVSSPDCQISDPGMMFSSQGFNLIGDGSSCNFVATTGDQVGSGGAPIDPLLGALTDNGGPDAGATPIPIPTHFPQPSSPALDAGNNVNAIGGAFPACAADDQRDVARPLGPRCDIGAVESTVDVDVAITKTDSPDPVNRGDNLTYTLTVTNNGPGSAGDIQVVDTLPPGLAFVSAMPSQGTCMEAALMVTCDLGILASGASATIDIVVTTTASGMLTNTATVTTTSNDTDGSNDSDTEDTTVNPVTDVSITKTDSADPVNVGDNITYTVMVTNNGPDNATGVSVMDTLPAGVNFVSATPSQGMCAEAAGLVTCNLGTLNAMANATVSIVVTTTANGILTNTVTVSADGIDTNPANNQASQTTAVGQVADLILSMSDSPDSVIITSNLTYVVTVANAGPNAASSVVLTDMLPSGVNFSSASTTQGTCGQASGVVTCDLGAIAVQASATVTIVVSPQSPGTITNNASVTLTEFDPNLANNSASATTDAVDFQISVTPASVTVTRGNTAVYTITLTPVGGRFNGSITLDCEMEPASTSCLFSPSAPTPGGAAINATLSLSTTAPSTATNRSPSFSPLYAALLLGPLGLLAFGAGRRRRSALLLLVLFLVLSLQLGCGGGDEGMPMTNPGTPVGTHTFTVRGVVGTLQRSTTVMVVVQ
jgi:uncharacterized repeat protein (TIGR01451 family)